MLDLLNPKNMQETADTVNGAISLLTDVVTELRRLNDNLERGRDINKAL